MTYEMGEQVGVCYPSRGMRPNRFKIGVVVKVSKTRVTVRTSVMVDGAWKDNDESFSLKSHYRIGDGDSWNKVYLTSVETARNGTLFAKQMNADLNKKLLRQSFCDQLKDAAGNNAKFMELLAELNSREYVA
jgi:hypothetical protein